MLVQQLIRHRWADFNKLENFELADIQDGCFSVNIDEGIFDCFLMKKDSPYLFVLLSGARDPKKSILPHFQRWRWVDRFPGSILCISDPSYHLSPEKLRLSWYVGTEKHNWMQSLSKLVEITSRKLGVKTSNVIAYGSSGGGFAALKLVTELKDATAVAINPQTDILKYVRKPVENFLSILYSGKKAEELSASILDRFSTMNSLQRSLKAKCIILQNKQDVFHYKGHYLPFCKYFYLDTEGQDHSSLSRINNWLYDNDTGHGPEPDELIPVLISSAVTLSNLTVTDLRRNTVVDADCSILTSNAHSSRILTTQIEQRYIKELKAVTNGVNFFKYIAHGRNELEPKNIYFPIDWSQDPFADRNWLAQLNMWRILDQNLKIYEENIEENGKWVSGFVIRVLEDWHYYHLFLKKKNICTWRDMIVGCRAQRLAYVISQVQHKHVKVSDTIFKKLDELAKVHLDFLMNIENIECSNHTINAIHGLAALAKVCKLEIKENVDLYIYELMMKLTENNNFDLSSSQKLKFINSLNILEKSNLLSELDMLEIIEKLKNQNSLEG